jgi:hypothetical protein
MLTDDQRFHFDLKGWLLLPGILDAKRTAEIRSYVLECMNTGEAIGSSTSGAAFKGPTAELFDHPAVVSVLEEILGNGPANPDFYDFRCEDSFFSVRSAGFLPGETKIPHVVRNPQIGGPMTYHCRNRRIYSGLTRVVWELNDVRAGMGGTQFVSGTHKAEFPFPDSVRVPDNALLETYSCPAGSALIFTESLLHASTAWLDHERQRVSIFTAYNSSWAQWYRMNLDVSLIDQMPKKRQTLFRGVYAYDFKKDSPTAGYNRTFSNLNHAL